MKTRECRAKSPFLVSVRPPSTGHPGGSGQFMGVQRKISLVKSFPKGSHPFGGDERQAGTTTITDLQVCTRPEYPNDHPTNSSLRITACSMTTMAPGLAFLIIEKQVGQWTSFFFY